MTTLVVIGTDCIGTCSCKSNYHAIMTATVPIADDTPCIDGTPNISHVVFLNVNDVDEGIMAVPDLNEVRPETISLDPPPNLPPLRLEENQECLINLNKGELDEGVYNSAIF